MEPTDANDRDVRLAPYLETYAADLAAGRSAAPETAAAPDELRAELEGLQSILGHLNEVLPRGAGISWETLSHPDTPSPDPASVANSFGADVPALIGRFQIVRLLGSGGFGMVFLAWDPLLCREVALKMPRPDLLLTPDARERFLREARTAAGLDHPNLVRVHEAGEVGPAVYLVTEFCAGPTLESWLRQQTAPVPVESAARLLAALAEGVAHIHRHGIIHRDLKPANVLLKEENHETHETHEKKTEDKGEQEQAQDDPQSSSLFSCVSCVSWFVPKITDFGLARDLEEQARLTQSGAVVGTPLYMAPEQAAGKIKEVGPAADVYALGAILYEVLTGRPPFKGQSTLETLDLIRTQPPRPPREVRPDTPPNLEAICLRCLQKDPAERYPSAAALAEDLNRFVQGLPVLVPQLAGTTRRRKAWMVLLGAIVVAGAALAAVVWDREWGRARENLAPAPDAVVGPLQVLRFNVQHFATIGKNAQPRGVLGQESFAAQLDDSVTVEAVLSRPAHAFLIAFRPDGTEELCFPEKEEEPPPLTDRPRYPSVSRAVHYGLNEGTGLQAFALVASERPLPAYREWRARRGQSPWSQHPGAGEVVWYDDYTFVEARSAKGVDRSDRAKGLAIPGRTPLLNLTDWLRPDADIAAAVGFTVQAKVRP